MADSFGKSDSQLIRCSSCDRAIEINKGDKRYSCPRCKKQYSIDKAKPYYPEVEIVLKSSLALNSPSAKDERNQVKKTGKIGTFFIGLPVCFAVFWISGGKLSLVQIIIGTVVTFVLALFSAQINLKRKNPLSAWLITLLAFDVCIGLLTYMEMSNFKLPFVDTGVQRTILIMGYTDWTIRFRAGAVIFLGSSLLSLYLLFNKGVSIGWYWIVLTKGYGIYALIAPLVAMSPKSGSPLFIIYSMGWNVTMIVMAMKYMSRARVRPWAFIHDRFFKSFVIVFSIFGALYFLLHIQLWREEYKEVKKEAKSAAWYGMELNSEGIITFPGPSTFKIYTGRYYGTYLGSSDIESLRNLLKEMNLSVRNVTTNEKVHLKWLEELPKSIKDRVPGQPLFTFYTHAGEINVSSDISDLSPLNNIEISVVKPKSEGSYQYFLWIIFGGLGLIGLIFIAGKKGYLVGESAY